MSNRFVIKVAGAAGQGIKTSGLVLAKALKRAGYCSFSYTEYPSLIRGGHNVFQIEVSDQDIASITKPINVLLALNEEAVKLRGNELKENGILIYDEGSFTLKEDVLSSLQERKIDVFPVPLLKLAKDSGGTALMKNTVSLGAIWKVFALNVEILQTTVGEIFNKTEEIIKANKAAVAAGYDSITREDSFFSDNFEACDSYDKNIILSGNESIGLGAITAGVRLYASYPMTPASSILTYLAAEGTKYGMVVKQSEDEITTSNMVIGASLAGTRAMCSTSGGGFDLMTETVSLAGITETPFVVVLAQRPGPGTGVPTWTAQGDLNIAIFAGHGEFPRIVIAVSDAQDAFLLTQEAHNLADRFQTPVVLLTDKYIAESFFSVKPFDVNAVAIDRGKLVQGEELKSYTEKLRYEITDDGVSARWLPGDKANTFLANSDEHTEKGYSTEIATEITAMMKKRMQKVKTIEAALPDPSVYGETDDPDICILSWGSNKGVILDAITEMKGKLKISYVHYSYMWPFKPSKALQFIDKAKHTFTVDNNAQAQFAELLKGQTGVDLPDRLTKFDGRPFYLEDIVDYIEKIRSKL